MMTNDRKQDTREKIQLGGLVKKAGLAELSTATLYGLLLEAAEKLSGNESESQLTEWKIKGDISLTQEK
jgi:hypothetical protein